MPVVAIRGLRRVNIPTRYWIALPHDVAHQGERAGHHRAAGLAGIEEFLFVDFLGDRMMADKHHLDPFVAAF